MKITRTLTTIPIPEESHSSGGKSPIRRVYLQNPSDSKRSKSTSSKNMTRISRGQRWESFDKRERIEPENRKTSPLRHQSQPSHVLNRFNGKFKSVIEAIEEEALQKQLREERGAKTIQVPHYLRNIMKTGISRLISKRLS